MAATISNITCEATLSANMTDAVEGNTLSTVLNQQIALSLTQGVGANQINAVVLDKDHTLSSPATVDIDLSSLSGLGTATDPLKNALTLNAVVAILIRVKSTSTGNLIVGAAGSNTWTAIFGDTDDTLIVRPGGFMLLAAPDSTGYAIGGSNKVLKLAPSAGMVTFDVVIFGRDT